MEMNGGFLVTKIKQLGDRIFEKILSEKNIDAFNGAQGRILYVLWQEDGISIRSLSTKCGLAITSLTTMLERMENQGLISRVQSKTDKRKTLIGETGRQRREQKRVEKENVLGGNAVFANLGPILILALPLMGNRLVLNLLGSAEAILIPSRLIDYGLTNKEALSIYGVLTSMALPFILFPSALTNSTAILFSSNPLLAII